MLKTGMIIGERYEIVGKIGTGGMADVYKAKDHKLNRFVAAKVLKAEFKDDTTFVRKFRSEAQAAAGLTHPNIVNVFDVGEDEGVYYIVMELIEGITLKEYISKKGKLSIKEATSIAIQVSMGLEAAHSHGIVHRDVKPQNIIISTDGKVKVTDFGIARAASSNTISSNVMGSVHYSSPEQVRGGYSDEKSDIYSLGITLYEMVTGKVPFDGDTTVAIAIKHLQEEMVPPSIFTPELPNSLEQIIYKCTQKSVDRRYQKMEDVIADLKHSLIDPQGDFVRLVPIDTEAKTLVISDNDLSEIKNNSGKVTVSKNSSSYAKPLEKEVTESDYDDGDEEEPEVKRQPRERKTKKRNRKRERAISITFLLIGIVVLIVLIYFIGKAAGIFGGDSGSTTTPQVQQSEEQDNGLVEVPNLLGKTEAEAAEITQALHIGVKCSGEEYSTEEKGRISSQDQAPGSQVQMYSTITYRISKGAEDITIPDLTGTMYDEALSTLLDKGLNVNVQRQFDEIEEEDVILGTEPAAGEVVTTGSTVNLIVSDNDAYFSEIPDELILSNAASNSSSTTGISAEGTEAGAEGTASTDTTGTTGQTMDTANASGTWKCTQRLNTPDGYQGGLLRLELMQEVNGTIKATTIVEGETLEFPYQLNIVGEQGIGEGDLRISEEIGGSYQELGYYPLTFKAE